MAMTQRSARDLVTDIVTATADGDYDVAVRAASWGIETFPDAAVFHRLRGTALVALGANEEAKEDLNRALTVDPLDHAALVTLSRLEEAEGDLYTAAEHLLTAWEHDPANGLLRSDLTHRLAKLYGSEGYLQYTRPALAALYVRNAYPERAAREYAAALAEQPARVDLRLASVLARWRLGALTEATDGCVMLLDEQPQLVRARWALADALARRGKGEEARDHARHAAQLDPDGAIARDLIEGNAEATIVDPDEMVRVSLDVVRSGPDVTALDPHEMPPAVAAMPPVWQFADEPEEATADDAHATAPFAATDHEAPDASPMPPPIPFPSRPDAEYRVPRSFEDDFFVAPPLAKPAVDDAIALPPAWQSEADRQGSASPKAYTPQTYEPEAHEPKAHAASAPPPADTIIPDPDAPAIVPPQPDVEPEPITAIATTDGTVVTMHPGDEPLLDATDAHPPMMQAPPASEPEPPAVAVAPMPPIAEAADAPEPQSGPAAVSAPEPEPAAAPPAMPAPHEPRVLPAPDATAPAAADLTPAALWPAMQARLAADDAAGALALGRASLTAAGKDTAQVRALLPALRSLTDAAPTRPDARRLLGDAYRRLGQTAQAQGQYQQALLVRVAGKK